MSSTLLSIILKKKSLRGEIRETIEQAGGSMDPADLGGSGGFPACCCIPASSRVLLLKENKQDAAWKTRKARSRVFCDMWQNRARPHEACRRRLVPWRFLAMSASRCATALYLPLCTRRQIASQGRDLFGEMGGAAAELWLHRCPEGALQPPKTTALGATGH